jgi:hypothetical protein
MLKEIRFATMLPSHLEETIQDLFFHHPEQSKFKSKIKLVIDSFGKPTLIKSGDFVTIKLSNESLLQQTVFVFNDDFKFLLLGVFVFVSIDGNLILAHLATSFDIEEINLDSILNEIVNRMYPKGKPKYLDIAYLNKKLKID